jgi:hypothetical protein
MAKDPVDAIQKILGEADDLIRQLLKESQLTVPHLVIGVTPDGQVVLCSNVSPDVLRTFACCLQVSGSDIQPGRLGRYAYTVQDARVVCRHDFRLARLLPSTHTARTGRAAIPRRPCLLLQATTLPLPSGAHRNSQNSAQNCASYAPLNESS